MYQTPEAKEFLTRIASLPAGPGVSLDGALQPSLDDEAELRKLFATDKLNARLNDPYVGLVDLFDAPINARTTRSRMVKDDEDMSRKYVMPLSEVNRRQDGTPSTVADLDEFKKNWSIFTEGSLSQLFDWNNVVAAGGSVLACLTPLSEAVKESKRSIRKYYHSAAYPASDIDLFLWGMDAEKAEKRIQSIYEAVRDSVPWDVTCVRTKHTISIHSQYPYRSVQIVLRLYRSPAEILAGFDIDAPCCLYNGERVWASPRAIVAMMRQCNTVDMTRRSPSYEVRLTKYSSRAFEVYVPTLERNKIDPTIYERSIARIEGLARLLVLENLSDSDTRFNFLESRRNLRGRPNAFNRYYRRKRTHKGDMKANISLSVLEMNDYDVTSLHIPYGPGWNARRIDKLVYQTDLGMNSTFNPKNKGRRLHRHPAFFGTMSECMEDCCENCPAPIDADERELQKQEDGQYIRGRISFIEEDPGRQSMTGSFNPIDVGEWSAQVYIGETEHFFAAIAAHDEDGVARFIEKGIDVNRRDHVGRAPLHVAILSKSDSIACALIDAGARMTARLVDGRSALHLAVQLDQLVVVRKLLERSAINKEQSKDPNSQGTDDVEMTQPDERPSSEDDWSSEDDDVVAMETDDEDDGEDENDDMDTDENDSDEEGEEDEDEDGGKRRSKKKGPAPAEEVPDETQDFPEDEINEPDILDVNLPDWDVGFTPLALAVISGSLGVIEILLAAGADPKLLNSTRDTAFHPLTVTMLRENEGEASKILERLILAGASTSTADGHLRTIFHRALDEGKLELVSTILRCDPNAKVVLDFPSFNWNFVLFPIVSAIKESAYAMLALILAHGAKVNFKEEDISQALNTRPVNQRQHIFGYMSANIMDQAYFPVETAIAAHDDVAQLLINIGATPDVGCRSRDSSSLRSIVDWVKFAIGELEKQLTSKQKQLADCSEIVLVEPSHTTWKACQDDLRQNFDFVQQLRNSNVNTKESLNEDITKLEETRRYLQDINHILEAHNAKTWDEIQPENPAANPAPQHYVEALIMSDSVRPGYGILRKYGSEPTPQHLNALYDELYEACFTGGNEKIQQLCLPVEGQSSISYPLNISVQITDSKIMYHQTGWTPLFAAIIGRRWNTAKLIMAIATAQYHPDEEDGNFTTDGITLDGDSDNESDDSDDSDMTVEQQEVVFVDIAKRPSAVQVDIHPKRLLDQGSVNWLDQGENGNKTFQYCSLLSRAIYQKDVEAFINILNLYKSSTLPIEVPQNLVEIIIQKDQAEMLDEFLRMTGAGIDIESVKKGGEELPATNDKNKLYLGLSVHGKKRMDLAKMNDPNATHTRAAPPLLWQACAAGAKAVVEYLAGGRPLEAYRFYASSNSDELALSLRRTGDLQDRIPQWLGWRVSPLGESPLTAAVLSKDLQLVKLLFTQKPRMMASTLHERVKFIGYNSLMLACEAGADVALVDYLLAKSVSPAEADQNRGWNIYHILCKKNHCDLIEHLFKKLPLDVTEALLSQQSKGRLNTPLHLAVKGGATRASKLIVDFTKSTILMRDIDGSTPLHAAVQRGFSAISAMLLAAEKSALYLENGVGETPLEMASSKSLLDRASNFANCGQQNPRVLSSNELLMDPQRINVKKLEIELPRLRATLDQLFHEGRLIKKTKLADELVKFADMMDNKLAAQKAAEDANHVLVLTEVEENKNPTEGADHSQTLKVISEAFGAAPGHRQLVHLVDVQKSVQGNLAVLAKNKSPNRPTEKLPEDGLQGEEDVEKKERDGSFVLGRINVHTDSY